MIIRPYYASANFILDQSAKFPFFACVGVKNMSDLPEQS
jgi:hypothetical protein